MAFGLPRKEFCNYVTQRKIALSVLVVNVITFEIHFKTKKRMAPKIDAILLLQQYLSSVEAY